MSRYIQSESLLALRSAVKALQIERVTVLEQAPDVQIPRLLRRQDALLEDQGE